ncbi:dipeptide epimerase [Alicyclobacillus sp. SO9]|uniref:dipeptide epimerase n=1 Tax=Alicyclobacillus sp. SO9 TaxID=2665646 RepID=UPI0018E8C47C|nr:dipeptide epimerase [Alicyclobacillus sp. SO9]QQE79184.1 dipeptide epimerase [Alicyclobacillus sp. SO9]
MARITRSAVDIVELPLSSPFHTSLRSAYSVVDIRVTLETDDGLIGIGSAAPTPKITGETTESILCALREFLLPAVESASLYDEIPTLETVQKSVVGNPAAKAAVDIALHDIYARKRGTSLAQYLNGSQLRPMATDATVSLNTPDAMELQALNLAQKGFRFLKIKLGGHDGQDALRVQRIREALGPDMPLRVDANQAWTVEESHHFIEQLAAFQVEFVEQPVYRRDLLGLREVTKRSPLPIAADESVFDAYDLDHILFLEAAHIINLKLMKTGGLYPAIQMVKTIQDAGLQWMVGSMMEGPASVTAAATLADAFGSHYKDLDAAYFLSNPLATDGPLYEEGQLQFGPRTGLGITFTHGHPEISQPNLKDKEQSL